MSLAKQTKTRFLQDKQLEMPDEDPSTWMTSRDMLSHKVLRHLKDLIKHKIKEDQKSDTKIEDGDSTSPLDPSLEKQIDFWDSLEKKVLRVPKTASKYLKKIVQFYVDASFIGRPRISGMKLEKSVAGTKESHNPHDPNMAKWESTKEDCHIN